MLRAVATSNRSAGSLWNGLGRNDESIAIFGVSGASLMIVWESNVAIHVCGSGLNVTAGWPLGRGRASSPISHAETGDTNTPSKSPAATTWAKTSSENCPSASQIAACVSRRRARDWIIAPANPPPPRLDRQAPAESDRHLARPTPFLSCNRARIALPPWAMRAVSQWQQPFHGG